MRLRWLISLLLMTLTAAAGMAADTKTIIAADDPVLAAMKAELQRSKEKLQLPEAQTPYYIEYSITDATVYSAKASFGALTSEQRARTRVLAVTVRVGDYKRDNSMGIGNGLVDIVSLDDDSYALRHSIWLTTDRAYKQALAAYAAKQAMLQRFQVEQPVEDFSHETSVTYLGDLVTLDLGKENWPQTLESLSGKYRSDPALTTFDASISFTATNRYFVNSEGTFTRKGSLLYQIAVNGKAQASDGMTLERSYGEITPTLAEFPSFAKLSAETDKVLQSLRDLRSAPVLKDAYQGPVLFAPKAADIIVSELIADNVTGTRPEPGSNARTGGGYAENYKTRILPTFVSVVDDPTLKSFKGESLPSAYEYDDEGVKAQTVTVVDKGSLVNYLTSRQPIRDFPRSNGHGRSQFSFYGPATTPSASTMIVTPMQSLAPEELKKKLIDLCKEQGLEYGYMVEEMAAAPPTNIGMETGRDNESKFDPRLLYKVWVKDGRKELVRGAELDGLDSRTLRTGLIALGNDPFLEGTGGELPVAVISPSMLFSDLEVKASEAGKDKLPQYPPPTLSAR